MPDNTDKSVFYQSELAKLFRLYHETLESQQFSEEDLDYSKLTHYIELLGYLDSFESNAYEIFDLYKKEHLFFSSKYLTLLGFDLENMDTSEAEVLFDSRIHPDDYLKMTEVGLHFLKFAIASNTEDKLNSKLFFDFRFMNAAGDYVRISKQHKLLEVDKRGNAWLSMGIINLSPEKNIDLPLKARLVNTITGEAFYFPENEVVNVKKHLLSEREIEILELVANGFASKQIAERLFISPNTVNTHRQRIIEKLDVKNTAEAIKLALNF